MTIRAVVVDDEPLARKRLRRLLGAHADVEVVAEAASGDEAAGVVLRERPDVVFLDVQMPGATGIQALRTLRASLGDGACPAAIFTTAYDQHAAEAFELDGVDYLLKPVEAPRLTQALERLRRRLGETGGTVAAPPTSAGHLAALAGERIVSLAFDEVACLLVEDGLVFAHTARGRHRVRSTLGELQDRLPAPAFVRVSRSAVLNLAWIEHLEPEDSGTYRARLRAPLELAIAVSRRRARELRGLLGW
jgi:DNA-binding LytR/AlgR family response regulator